MVAKLLEEKGSNLSSFSYSQQTTQSLASGLYLVLKYVKRAEG